MAANVYECMVLFDSNKYAGDSAGLVNQVHTILQKHGAEILASRPWDERRLAYNIRKHKKGTYYLIYFKAEGKTIRPVEADFQLNETMLRFIILKIDAKLVDTMLALARDEHALAVQTPGLVDEPVGSTAGAPVPAAVGAPEEAEAGR